MPGGMGFGPTQLTPAHCCAPPVGIAPPPPIGSDGRLATGPASTLFPGGSGPVPSGDGVVSASDDEVTAGDASVSDDTADADLLGVTSDLPQPTPITASTETTTTRGAQRPRWFRSFMASPPLHHTRGETWPTNTRRTADVEDRIDAMTGQPFSCSPQVARSFVRALYHAHPPIDWMWQVPVTPAETGHRQGGGGQRRGPAPRPKGNTGPHGSTRVTRPGRRSDRRRR